MSGSASYITHILVVFSSFQKVNRTHTLRLLVKKTNMFTVAGFRRDLWHATTFPAALNTLSEGVLVAGMHKYFFAK